jgi:hypothetical protein
MRACTQFGTGINAIEVNCLPGYAVCSSAIMLICIVFIHYAAARSLNLRSGRVIAIMPVKPQEVAFLRDFEAFQNPTSIRS